MERGDDGVIPLGFTGLEDELQHDVGKTVDNLAKANVATWVLTGDKTETGQTVKTKGWRAE